MQISKRQFWLRGVLPLIVMLGILVYAGWWAFTQSPEPRWLWVVGYFIFVVIVLVIVVLKIFFDDLLSDEKVYGKEPTTSLPYKANGDD